MSDGDAYNKNNIFLHPPSTRNDVRQYIVSWIKPVLRRHERIDNEWWVVEYGFNRGFHANTVFRQETTGEYAFHVCMDDNFKHRLDGFPNFGRYCDYESMITGIVEKYATLWLGNRKFKQLVPQCI